MHLLRAIFGPKHCVCTFHFHFGSFGFPLEVHLLPVVGYPVAFVRQPGVSWCPSGHDPQKEHITRQRLGGQFQFHGPHSPNE